jgi:hypothetical protein
MQSVHYCCQILTKMKMCRQHSVNPTGISIHEKLYSGSRVSTLRRTGGKRLTNLRKPHFCNTHLRTRKKFTCDISENRPRYRIQPVNVVRKEKSLVFQTKETSSCTLLDKCRVVNAVIGSRLHVRNIL